jgi:uracil-DNA glycosylase family 4
MTTMAKALDRRQPAIPLWNRPANCAECPFKTLTICSKGPENADFVVIGESPGKQEGLAGIPFVGPSGKLIHGELAAAGVNPAAVLFDNAFRCLPKGDKQLVLADACQACAGRLRTSMEAHPRTVILALGNAAVWSLTGWYDLKITKARGKPILVSLNSEGLPPTVVVPAIHPAALFRGTGTLEDFRRDIQLAVAIYNAGGDVSSCAPKGPANYFIIDTEDKLCRTWDYVKKNCIELVACDIETTGFNPRVDELLSLAIYLGGNKVGVLTPEVVYSTTGRAFMASPEPRKLWHNGKFDVGFLRAHGVWTRTDEDLMLANYALEERGGYHGLETIAGNLLHEPPYKEHVKKYIPKGGNYGDIPRPILYEYNARDSRNTGDCFTIVRARISSDPNLHRLYYRTLLPASELLTKVEANGFWVDKKQLLSAHRSLKARTAKARQEFEEAVVGELGSSWAGVSPSSPKQVFRLLFDEMKLHEKGEDILKWRKLGNKISTDKEVLKRLQQVPIVVALQEIRKAEKLHSTYVVGCFNAIDPTDQRVHATYLLHGTTTGRLASRGPNLQNIPRDSLIRSIYAAPPGRILIEADYNQAELRVLAILSKAPWLLQVYREGRKLHDEMSEFLFGKDYTKEDKMKAKTVNFGIPYGRGANSIASVFGVSRDTAQSWIDDWFKRVPEAQKFLVLLAHAAASGKTITTPFGNKRRFALIGKERKHEAENEARNFPMSAIASHCTLHAAIQSFDRLYALGAWIVNLVHDSIIVECDNTPMAIRATAEILKDSMEEQPKKWLNSPIDFPAEFKVSPNWGMQGKVEYVLET